MKTPGKILRRKKITLRSLPTNKIEELLNDKKQQLKKIKSLKKLYNGCYVDSSSNMFFTHYLEDEIALIENVLNERAKQQSL